MSAPHVNDIKPVPVKDLAVGTLVFPESENSRSGRPDQWAIDFATKIDRKGWSINEALDALGFPRTETDGRSVDRALKRMLGDESFEVAQTSRATRRQNSGLNNRLRLLATTVEGLQPGPLQDRRRTQLWALEDEILSLKAADRTNAVVSSFIDSLESLMAALGVSLPDREDDDEDDDDAAGDADVSGSASGSTETW